MAVYFWEVRPVLATLVAARGSAALEKLERLFAFNF
jgi:hypothetical protein